MQLPIVKNHKLNPLWNNLDIAKGNLKRIDEHNRYMCYIEDPRFYSKKITCPTWLYQYWNHKIPQPLYYGENYDSTKHPNITSFHTNYSLHYYVPLVLDDGSVYKQSAFWIGYFETLYGASIKPEKEDGWSFSY